MTELSIGAAAPARIFGAFCDGEFYATTTLQNLLELGVDPASDVFEYQIASLGRALVAEAVYVRGAVIIRGE